MTKMRQRVQCKIRMQQYESHFAHVAHISKHHNFSCPSMRNGGVKHNAPLAGALRQKKLLHPIYNVRYTSPMYFIPIECTKVSLSHTKQSCKFYLRCEMLMQCESRFHDRIHRICESIAMAIETRGVSDEIHVSYNQSTGFPSCLQ